MQACFCLQTKPVPLRCVGFSGHPDTRRKRSHSDHEWDVLPRGTAGIVKLQQMQERGGPCLCPTTMDNSHQQLHLENSVGGARAAPASFSTQAAGQTPALHDGGSMPGQITEGGLVAGGPFCNAMGLL